MGIPADDRDTASDSGATTPMNAVPTDNNARAADAAAHAADPDVAELLNSRRYDPDILPRLEAHVTEQAAGGAQVYDADANFAALKLYQFRPDGYDRNTIALVLAKAAMALPAADFACCLHQLPEWAHEHAPVPQMVELVDCLETGNFELFWSVRRGEAVRALLDPVRDFDDAVRRFMLDVLARTCSRVAVGTVARLLGTDDATGAASRAGWLVEDGGSEATLVAPASAHNQMKPTVIAEQLPFSRVGPMLSRLGRETGRYRGRGGGGGGRESDHRPSSGRVPELRGRPWARHAGGANRSHHSQQPQQWRS